MGKNRFVYAFLCFIILCMVPGESVYGAQTKDADEVLTVGVPADRTPVFYRDPDTDEITGIGVELMRIVARYPLYSHQRKR